MLRSLVVHAGEYIVTMDVVTFFWANINQDQTQIQIICSTFVVKQKEKCLYLCNQRDPDGSFLYLHFQ